MNFNFMLTWMNLTKVKVEEKKLDPKKYTLYDSIYLEYKNKQNKSLLLEVRVLVTFERK